MRDDRTLQLEDTFEYQTIPFLVQVEDRDMFIHGSSGSIRGINMYGAPTGEKRGGRKWVRCRCRVARIRPDYPYTIDEEWPESIDKHVRVVDPFEIPEKGLFFYGKRDVDSDPRAPQEMAQALYNELQRRYESVDQIESFDP